MRQCGCSRWWWCIYIYVYCVCFGISSSICNCTETAVVWFDDLMFQWRLPILDYFPLLRIWKWSQPRSFAPSRSIYCSAATWRSRAMDVACVTWWMTSWASDWTSSSTSADRRLASHSKTSVYRDKKIHDVANQNECRHTSRLKYVMVSSNNWISAKIYRYWATQTTLLNWRQWKYLRRSWAKKTLKIIIPKKVKN